MFLFIDSWNILSPTFYSNYNLKDKFGYNGINTFSKALFNISYNNVPNLDTENDLHIAVQAHIYFIGLTGEIFQRLKNIEFKFDLFITITSSKNKDFIKTYIENNTQIKKYEIKIVNNKGRDVLPFLEQMKKNIKNYKYICHIHTKKSIHITWGDIWRNYLQNNLLGDKKLVNEIFYNFEKKEDLGFVFPELIYLFHIDSARKINTGHRNYLNLLLKIIFPNKNYKVNNIIDFPAGNMFWAKTKAVYQIFDININDFVPNENGQKDFTIIHAVERIWLYLIKLNGFYYQKIFKSF